MLLKNEGSLPLEKGTTLSFVSGNSRDLGVKAKSMLETTLGIEGGSTDALTPAMEQAGFSVNKTLTDFYATGKGKDYVMGPGSVSYGDDEDFSINECPLSVMRDAGVLDSMEGTTPVYVLKRVAGEGRDMPRSMYNHASSAEDRAKSYLEPDSTELEILQYLNDNFDNTVLVVNSNAAVELDWLADFPNIKSVLIVPTTGTYGVESLGRILSGDINPPAAPWTPTCGRRQQEPGRPELRRLPVPRRVRQPHQVQLRELRGGRLRRVPLLRDPL